MRSSSVKIYFYLIIALIIVSSCRGTREMRSSKQEMQENRILIEQIKANTFRYKALDIKKLTCQIQIKGTDVKLSGTLSSQHNKFVDVNLNKFIPLAKAHLTPKEYSVISILQKGYYAGEYSSLEELLGTSVNYELLQAALTSSIGDLLDTKLNAKNTKVSTVNEQVVLQTIDDISLPMPSLGNQNARQNETLNLSLTILANAQSFLINTVKLVDETNKIDIEIQYSDYLGIEDQNFPTSIKLMLANQGTRLEAKFKMNRISLSKKIDSSFKIPEKYEKLN